MEGRQREEQPGLLAARQRAAPRVRKCCTESGGAEPGAPLRAMALVDREKPRDSAVFLSGNPANRGPEAPRRFLEGLGGPERPRFADGSGRRVRALVFLRRAISVSEGTWLAGITLR